MHSFQLDFPVVIIDDDYHSEQMRGTLIRLLAEELESQGMKVIGGFSMEDAGQAILTYSEVSAVLLSIEGSEENPNQYDKLRPLIEHMHRRNDSLPVFLCGERESIS